MLTETVIDIDRFNNLKGLLGDLFDSFMEQFNTNGDSCVQTITAYKPELDNHAQVAEAAHKLKSSAGYLGAVQIAELMEEIEISAKNEHKERLFSLTEATLERWTKLMNEMNNVAE